MHTLEIVMLVLWFICMGLQLFRSKDFWSFFFGSILDGIFLGFIYVVIHLIIKHW